jgi:hypothetical protein
VRNASRPSIGHDGLGDVGQLRLLHRLLTDAHQLLFDLLARGRDDLFDPRRVDAPVLDEPLEAQARDFAPYGSKQLTTTTPACRR